MTVPELLHDIATTRIGLAPSPIHGIGVFALVDLPEGTRGLFSPPQPWVPVPEAEIDALPSHAQRLVRTYCLWDNNTYFLPPNGFRILDMVMYLNHAETPNLRVVNGGDDFITTRRVQAGEELTVDYRTLET
jgi:SET domain-containing protein